MEQTTLQQRIEERAKERLLKDLREVYNKEQEITAFIGGEEYPPKLLIRIYYGNSYSKDSYKVDNDFTQKVFDKLLPNYIRRVTDEILESVDELRLLVANKELQEDLP